MRGYFLLKLFIGEETFLEKVPCHSPRGRQENNDQAFEGSTVCIKLYQ